MLIDSKRIKQTNKTKEKKNMREFLLSDESLNSLGLVVKTSGINMERFIKNPIMLYMHDRSNGIVGRWDKLRVENIKFYGTPVFDDVHEPGKTIKEKVESGFLNGASIGIEKCVIELINNVRTVVSCELVEVSICDIPSNKNAVQLYYDNNPVDLPTYLKLSINQKTMNEQDFESLLQALGLPDTATIDDVLSGINTLKGLSPTEKDVKECLHMAHLDGIIQQEEIAELEEIFLEHPLKLSRFIASKRKLYEDTQKKEYRSFVDSNKDKFRTYSSDFIFGDMQKLAMKNLDVFKSMINKAPVMFKPMDIINKEYDKGGVKLKHEWTLDDYRKNAPNELRNNPSLYDELVKKELSNNK